MVRVAFFNLKGSVTNENDCVINGSLTSHSRVPELLAGVWVGGREAIYWTGLHLSVPAGWPGISQIMPFHPVSS
jgi:hypothetical protein